MDLGGTGLFDDPEFAGAGRGFIYYARAIQAPTPAINADGLRCADESCQSLDPCYGDYRVDVADDCLSDNEERAWSSPIFVHFRTDAAAGGSADAGSSP